ncbi:MAG: multidrug effflux MFS transporter [Marinosulfonomonas sp.]|nr:multidrug effflux MFS transporter [Marinosulfonomonas sp.]
MSSKPTVRFLDRTTPPHLFTLIFTAAMSSLTMNMFLPSLPSISEYFNTEYRVIQLALTLYLGTSGLLQIIIGPMSDRFGRRNVLIGGFVIFSFASLGCVFAQSAEVFLVFRVLQASIAVAMVLSRAIVRDMVPQDQAASMLGYITMFIAISPMVSPAIGGFIDEAFGWRAIFWCLFVAGLIAIALIWADLGETNTHQSSSFSQQFSEYPELLTSHRFWGYCGSAGFATGAFFAYLGGAPFIGVEVFGLSPSKLGYFLGAPALGYIFGNFITGRYSMRFGANKMVLVGATIGGFGAAIPLVLFNLGFGTPLAFFGSVTLVGLGNGMVLPNATSGMLSVRPHLAGTASGLGGALMTGGGGALAALAGVMLVPGSGPYPLLWIMLTTSSLSVVSIIWVVLREKQVGIR